MAFRSVARVDNEPLPVESALRAVAPARAPGILQWHHLLTSEGSYPKTTVAGLEANTFADGLFHAATWLAVAVGIYLLWRTTDGRRAIGGRACFGWMLVGWGLFNVVEGVINHQVLTLHHVREGAAVNETAWDIGFLAFGALLVVGGWLLTRSEDASRDDA